MNSAHTGRASAPQGEWETVSCTDGHSKKHVARGFVIPILPCPLLSSSSPLCPVCAGVTLPTAKPTASLGPFGEGSKPAASLCQHGALQTLSKPPALWDVPAAGRLYGTLPSGCPSSQKLTGMKCVGSLGTALLGRLSPRRFRAGGAGGGHGVGWAMWLS